MKEARVYLSAGEPSGDQHAAGLVRALREHRPGWSFVGLGGECMEAAGVELRTNLVDRAVMGVRRVVAELGSVLRLATEFLEEILSDPPDLVVLIDYPGFNLNLARMARRQGIPVVYYVCPQVWAWGPWRLRRVASRADLLLVILPFEEEIYSEVHPEVAFVGNPIFDHLAEVEQTPYAEEFKKLHPLLGLFPGSRRQEVEEALPAMLQTARCLQQESPELQVRISCHRPGLLSGIEGMLQENNGVRAAVVEGSPHDLQRAAHLSLVVSGTATLEQAYFGIPMVVLYPVKAWERHVFSAWSVTPFFSLVNLVAGRAVVPEILFTKGEEQRILEAARGMMAGAGREQAIADLAELREQYFHPGGAERAAIAILEFLDGVKAE
ncbi:MAG: lipid-A-disaccharide synthase [Planctomycetota bacterium]